MTTKYNPRIVTDGLVLCLDAGNTKSHPGTGLLWTDISGNGNNGTLTGAVNDGDGSMVFDGTNDHVDFPSSSDFTFGTGDFTISWWINYNVVGTNDSTIDMRGSSWQNTALSDYITSDSKWATWRWTTSYPSADDTWYTSSATLVTDKWYNFVALRDSGTFKFYINNVLDGSVTFNESLAGGDLILGWNTSSNAGRSFDGKLSSILMYKGKALSATEVTQNYNALKGRYL